MTETLAQGVISMSYPMNQTTQHLSRMFQGAYRLQRLIAILQSNKSRVVEEDSFLRSEYKID